MLLFLLFVKRVLSVTFFNYDRAAFFYLTFNNFVIRSGFLGYSMVLYDRIFPFESVFSIAGIVSESNRKIDYIVKICYNFDVFHRGGEPIELSRIGYS